MAANSKGIKNWPCLIRMLLFHPITRDDGFHPPLGSFDASLGPTALGKHQNSLGVDKTHNPLWWGGTISHYSPVNENPRKQEREANLNFKWVHQAKNQLYSIRMLLLHPIPRAHGYYWPLGSVDAALGLRPNGLQPLGSINTPSGPIIPMIPWAGV